MKKIRGRQLIAVICGMAITVPQDMIFTIPKEEVYVSKKSGKRKTKKEWD